VRAGAVWPSSGTPPPRLIFRAYPAAVTTLQGALVFAGIPLAVVGLVFGLVFALSGRSPRDRSAGDGDDARRR